MTQYDQLTMPFQSRPALGRLDFVVSGCNRDAVALIDAYPHWGTQGKSGQNGHGQDAHGQDGGGIGVILVGDEKCGKTHLCHVWGERTGAIWLTADDFQPVDSVAPWVGKIENSGLSPVCVIVDDCHLIDNHEQVFNLYNRMVDLGGKLLLTGADTPQTWGITVPDLLSRLSTMALARIANPDDMMLGMLLVKLFNDRQLQVPADVILYVVKRLPRTYDSIADFVNHADAQGLQDRRSITVPLVRAVLDKMETQTGTGGHL